MSTTLSSCKHANLARWLTAFIFAAQSYSQGNARLHFPLGVNVSIKHAAEAFVFLAL
jgi:hypothetical protein